MSSETLSFSTKGGDTTAYVMRPESPNGKAVIIIQEWWGLNPHIKDIAGRYADEGFIAIAPDLYRGKLAKDPAEAGEMMNALSLDDGIDTIEQAAAAARAAYGVNHFGITGYCMGGTFSLRAACLVEGFAAAAPFYGDIPEEEVLSKLTTPVVFISGIRDGWIDPAKVAQLEAIAEKYELPIETVKYDADHAFFNDTRPEVYDPVASADAWALVIGFFNEKL